MGVVRLDFYDNIDETFDLIALHTTVPFYRLAFYINKYLGLNFHREDKDQDVIVSGTQVNYPVFKHIDPVHNLNLYLVPNKSWAYSKNSNNLGSLFETIEPELIKTILIKEHLNVDFFLKIEQQTAIMSTQDTVNALVDIPAILSAYQIDPFRIKQKDYLIFE